MDEDATFRAAIDLVLAHEGGYVNDARDPGGETNFGISKRSYPTVDIAGLTKEGAIAIYRRDYWDKLSLGRLPPGVAMVTLDAAVNSGTSRAVQWLQRCVDVKVDGVIGPMTIAAVRGSSRNGGQAKLIEQLLAERLLFLAGLGTWVTFRKGWTLRVLRLAATSGGPTWAQ